MTEEYEVKRVVIRNTNKFRQAAIHFETYGYYTAAPKGTTAYMNYWQEEREKGLNGCIVDGDYITGYFYFYLNYCQIIKTIKNPETGKSRRVKGFPDYYDYDKAYYDYIEACEQGNRHAVVIKARRKGFSFKGAGMLCRNFYLIPNSKSYAVASDLAFLTKDGLLTKAWGFMSFIDEHTAWAKKRQKIDSKIHKRASLIIDIDGVKTEVGYMSEIIGISLSNDADKIRGISGKLILFEESGKFSNLLDAWQIARPSVEDVDGTAYGLLLSYGTGGEADADYQGLKYLFYEPDVYKCLPVKNIWDEGATKPCGFFVPHYYNMSPLYMDEDGNSLVMEALKFSLQERDYIIKNSTNRQSVDRYITERPHTPAEATLQLSGNIFPKTELNKHLSFIRVNKAVQEFKQVGELYFDNNGILKWEQAKIPTDITSYRIGKGMDTKGSIVIWEHPEDNPPYCLYIGGCLLPGEKVLTNRGLMNVEDVKYSERLVDKDGDLVDIKALLRYNKKDEDVYTLKMSNSYRPTTFTKEHPIYVSEHPLNKQKCIKEKLFDFDFKKVSEVKVGDWVKYPNVYLNTNTSEEDYVNYIPKEYWWFVGLWLGDGWCSRNNIYIAFDKTNVSQLKRFTKFVKKYYNKDVNIRERIGSIECSFNEKRLAEQLTDTYGQYAYGKTIPEHIKYEENEIKKQLLLGFLDSDGCVYKDSRGYISLEYVGINLKLLESFQDIAFSLGMIGNLSKLREEGEYNIRGRTGIQKKAYHLRFGHTDSLIFAELCNFDDRSKLSKIDRNNIKTIATRRKNGCFISEDKKYIYIQIKEIEKAKYTGTVYNFETETHSFVCRYITTHNCDPYDFDKSGTNSLGSVFIYKRFQSFEKYYETLVAEYTGRPETAEEFYENVRKLLIYYNAICLYENEKKGIFQYFAKMHCEHLLADQPSIIKDIVKDSIVHRGKGIHATKGIQDWAEGKIKEWLVEDRGDGQLGLHTILSEPLLEELISFNDDGNFDRVIALSMIMVYREELHNIQVKKRVKQTYTNRLFPEGIFVEQAYHFI